MTGKNEKGTAVVTGATGGVGSKYAKGLAERGYDLLLLDINLQALQTLATDIAKSTGRKVAVSACDLANADELDKISHHLSKLDDLTLLANIAGAATFSSFKEISNAKIDQTIAVNISALTHLCRAVIPGFAKNKKGTIVNFASILAFHTWAEFNVYNAAKAFVVSLSQSLQEEFRKDGILIQVISPPATATPFWKEAGFSYDKLPPTAVMKVEDLISAALIALDSREEWVMPSLPDVNVWKSYQTGRANLVNGMMSGTLAERYSKK